MDLPTYNGDPLSYLVRLDEPGPGETALWQWGIAQKTLPGDINTIDHLISAGYVQVPSDKKTYPVEQLLSQCCDVRFVHNGSIIQGWTRPENMEHTKRNPVILAFTLDNNEPTFNGRIPMLQILPLPRLGQWGVITQNGLFPYHCTQLPEHAQELCTAMGESILHLAGESQWTNHTEAHAVCASEINYQRMATGIRTEILHARGKKQREESNRAITKLEVAHAEVNRLRQSWLQPDWLVQWAEVRKMAQQLAEEYYNYHRKVTQEHRTYIAPITSSQQTMLPSNNAFRGLEQGFAPALIKHSLWQDQTEHQIATPNGTLLQVRGQQEFERKALTQYINEMIGVEGLKHMLTLLDTYYTQTGAKDRRDDARISIRQLLIRMGYSETQADDINERRKLAHSVLYLARTWVTSSEVSYEKEEGPRGGRRPGQKRRKGVNWTPLLVIEEMQASEDGGLEIPDEIGFHLGKDFYSSMFGENSHFFYLPTAQVLSYHADREQQELCLAFYLTNMIFIQQRFTIHFRELALQSGLMTEEEIEHGHDRTRAAMRIVYALERLEKDGLVRHGEHAGLDIPLAVDLITHKCKESDLSPATLQRIKKSYGYLRGKGEKELREARRKGLQRLLHEKEKDAILFGAGHLMVKKVEQREQQREQAIEHNEQAMVARVVKSASKQIGKGHIVDGSVEKQP